MEVTNKKVLVFGTGISGIGAAKLLLEQRAQVILYDGNEQVDCEKIRGQFDEGASLEIVLGVYKESLLAKVDLVVLSPGVPTDLPLVIRMKEANIPIIGEIELAYGFAKGDILAITGTNGKTTTTVLLGQIIKAYQEDVYVVGNIGKPYTSIVGQTKESTITVAEISSFQLETIQHFRPKVSGILNITPDHLNRHYTMEAYTDAKKKIARNQTEEDYCILNYEDEILKEFGKNTKAKVLYFSSQRKLEEGIYLCNGEIVYKREKEVKVCTTDELQVLGTHNFENVMVAVAMALVYGVSIGLIRDTIKRFKGVEHRIEFVVEKQGITYYNDSKGTNPDAAIKGIQAMNRKTVLIGGGYDKDSSYTEWIESFQGKVKKLVLVGETKEKIAREAQACGFEDYVLVDTFEEAVRTSASIAQPGEAVLLSPACASWGMFPNYEIRGEKFKEIVNSL